MTTTPITESPLRMGGAYGSMDRTPCPPLPGISNNPATVTTTGSVGLPDSRPVDGFHLDWLTLIVEWDHKKLEDGSLGYASVIGAIAEFVCGEPDAGILQRIETASGLELYRMASGGVDLTCSGGMDGRERVTLNIRGRAWEWVERSAVCDFWSWCVEAGVRVHASRMDLAWDDPGFEFDVVDAAWEAGDIRCPASTEVLVKKVRDAVTGLKSQQSTFYAGSRESRRRLRIYDMRGVVRVELQLRGERAERARELVLCNNSGAMREVLLAESIARGLLIDFCEFVDAGSGGNISRRSRLGWWEDFVSGVQRVRCIIPRVVQAVEDVQAWVESTVAASLSLVHDGLNALGRDGGAWLTGMMDRGRERWKPKHQRIYNAACLVGLRRLRV